MSNKFAKVQVYLPKRRANEGSATSCQKLCPKAQTGSRSIYVSELPSKTSRGELKVCKVTKEG